MYTVIFDLDGTLVDTSLDLMIAGNKTFEQLGWKARLSNDFSDGVVIGGGRSMIRHGFKQERLKFSEEDVNRIYPTLISHYERSIDKNSFIYDGVIDSLEKLKKLGWKIGLCTNKPVRQAHILLTKLGIRSYFDSFVGAGTIHVTKPRPEPLLEAMNLLSGSLSTTVLVGDTLTDRDTAKAANVKCLLVNYGHGALVYDIRALEPDAIVETAKELPESVNKLFLN